MPVFETFRLGLVALGVLGAGFQAQGQTPVPVGKGSYASTVPNAHLNDDGYYSPTPKTMLGQASTVYLSAQLRSKPIPTNQWWTDLAIGQRSANGKWFQKQFDDAGNAGELWTYPGMVQPSRTGKTLYFPAGWVPNSGNSASLAQGSFDRGPGVVVENFVGLRYGAGDVPVGDFTGIAYPSGWTASGDLKGTAPIIRGTWPGQSPQVSGLVGDAALNTYRGTDTTQGALTSANFTLQNDFIDLKVAGGDDVANTCVQLLVGGKAVRTAVGQRDGTLRWTQWDVREFKGKSAQVVVRDSSTGSWGFIVCNLIVATNNAGDPAGLFGSAMTVDKAVVSTYSDWAIDYTQSGNGGSQVVTTLARGIPFVWDRLSSVSPRIYAGDGTALFSSTGAVIKPVNGSFIASNFAFSLIDGNGVKHTFGVFAPDNTQFLVKNGYVQAQKPSYLVYGFLPDRGLLGEFAKYAFARPTATALKWSLNMGAANASSPGGSVDTVWTVTTSPLKGVGTETLQGWLPHHYRTTNSKLVFKSYRYLTPRGTMLMSSGNEFAISWPFRGIAPVLPAPKAAGRANDFDAARMVSYLKNFAAGHPGSGGDTYWQGKEFGLSGQYMTMAAQLEASEPFFKLQGAMRTQLQDWMTYKVGEEKNFFANYPNWGAMIGFNTGYGSAGFNDLHFHYGYFQVGSALLGMHDASYLNQYGPMVKRVAKQYNNWDRTDSSFPFMRCFDIWEGHCNAGGVSSPGGQNQESSSESMNAWVGMFLAGNMMGDQEMAAAGAMGYAVESSAVNEYWQDWRKTNFPVGYGKATAGIVGSGGVAYGTFFSGDPAWIYAIQWTPANHWNNYLVRDRGVAVNQLSSLWKERVTASDYNKKNNPNGFILNDANDPAALGAYPGAYVLGFSALSDPTSVAKLFDEYGKTGKAIVTDATYPGSVYYLAHSLRGIGDQDLNSYTSIPTSQVYINSAGKRTYIVYNPLLTAQKATVYTKGTVAGTVTVPAHSLVATSSFGGVEGGSPYFGVRLGFPGILEFVNYNYGGEGVGYHDLDAKNSGQEYRPDEGVDIVAAADGSYDVTSSAGEWMKFSVRVAKAGTYSAFLKVASSSGGAISIVDEAAKSVVGPTAISATGGAQKYQTIELRATLTEGVHELKVQVTSGQLSLNRLILFATGSAAEVPLGKTISVRSEAIGQFVSAEDAGSSPLIANRGSASTWEQFTVEDRGKGLVALKASANGKYVSLVATSGQLVANSTTVSTGQLFTWVDLGAGKFALRSQSNGKFVTVPSATKPLTVTGVEVGKGETFTYGMF